VADYDQALDRSGVQALMPEEVAREIIQNVPKTSAALRLFPRVTMSRKQERMPVLSALPQAYWVNGDTGLKKTSKQAWENKYLNAEPIAVIVPIPEEVLDDSDYDVWAEIRPRIEAAIGRALDLAVFFGTDMPSGWMVDDIVSAATAAGNVYGLGDSGVDLAEDINQMMALVEADDFDVTGFVAHRGMKSRFRGLRDLNNQPIFIQSLRGGDVGGDRDTLYNEEIVFVSRAGWDTTQAHVIGGDFSQGILGVRQDITYKMLDQAVITDENGVVVLNLAQQDSVALRAVARFGFQVANPLQDVSTGWSATGSSDTYPFGVLTP
jgi:HK97 family phage major capsid protein